MKDIKQKAIALVIILAIAILLTQCVATPKDWVWHIPN